MEEEKMSDLISREAVLKGISLSCTGQSDAIKAEAALVRYVKKMPSAQPERKTGKWVGVKEYCDHINEKAEREGKGHRFIPSGMNNCVYCNQCWESNDRRTTYCPNCGADMRGGEDETD